MEKNSGPRLLLKQGLILLVCFPLLLNAQNVPEERPNSPQVILESLLDEAVFMAGKGEWAQAWRLLVEAENIYPGNEKLDIYKKSLKKLQRIENEYESEGTEQIELPEENNESAAGEQASEVFVINHLPEERSENLETFRDYVRIFVGIKLLNIDSQNTRRIDTFHSGTNFIYSYFNMQIRGWFPFLSRSVGLVAQSSGFEVRNFPAFYNKINFGANIRGFLFEHEKSRMEIGADIGVTMNNHLIRDELERFYTLLMRVWIRDPLLYRVFNNDALSDIIVHGYFAIYPTIGSTKIDILNYGFDFSWNFSNYLVGAAFDWWDDREGEVQSTSFGFSIFMGYQF